MTYTKVPLKDVVWTKSGNSKLIKGKLSKSTGDGLFPAFSASGQDVWTEHAEYHGDGIILSAVGARCGKCFLAKGSWTAIANTHVLVPDATKVLQKYLWYLVNDEAFWIRSGSAQPFVSMRKSLENTVPLPDLAVQQAIVDEIETQFARLDDAESALRRAEVRLEKLRVSSIESALQDLTTHERQVVPLGELLEKAEYGTSIKCDYDFDGAPVLRIPNVAKGRIELTDIKYASEELKSEKSLSDGDILIIRTNGSKSLVGRSAIYRNLPTDRYWFASYLLRFRLDPEAIRPEWLYWVLESKSGRNWIDTNAASSAGQHNISVSKLKGFVLPLPKLDTQDQVIEHLEREDSLIEQLKLTVNRSTEKIHHLRQTILKNAFEGNYGQ